MEPRPRAYYHCVRMGAARLLRGFRDNLRQIDPWVEGENIFGPRVFLVEITISRLFATLFRYFILSQRIASIFVSQFYIYTFTYIEVIMILVNLFRPPFTREFELFVFFIRLLTVN